MNRILLVGLILAFALAEKCRIPPTASGYSEQCYLGKWYYMGKYQTAGGAFFERDCFCTESDITRDSSKTYAYQSCVKNQKRTGINATLVPTDTNGKYVEQFGFNKANYYVIHMDKDYAIYYDCSEALGETNYCVHIMSRTLLIPDDKLAELKEFSLGLDLNPRNLPFHRTYQFTCRNSAHSNLFKHD